MQWGDLNHLQLLPMWYMIHVVNDSCLPLKTIHATRKRPHAPRSLPRQISRPTHRESSPKQPGLATLPTAPAGRSQFFRGRGWSAQGTGLCLGHWTLLGALDSAWGTGLCKQPKHSSPVTPVLLPARPGMQTLISPARARDVMRNSLMQMACLKRDGHSP